MVPLVSTAISREDIKRAVLLAALPGVCHRIDSLYDLYVVFFLLGSWMGFLTVANSLNALLNSPVYWISSGLCAMVCAWCWRMVWLARRELRVYRQPIYSIRQYVRWRPVKHVTGRT